MSRKKYSWRQRREVIRRWCSICLIAALALTGMQGIVMAEVQPGEGVCVHHTEHTEECGYQEAHRCRHKHEQECYEVFDEEKDGGREAMSNAALLDATPSDATPSDATPSDLELENCTHIHDDFCGYAEAHPCEYYCKLCAGEELSLEEQAKVMEAQIKAQTEDQAASRTRARGYSQTFSFAPTISPFVIGSEAVLRELAEKVNGGETWSAGNIAYAECTYVLTADITLASGWEPVGTEEHPFTGIFDGSGFVIRGVEIDGQGSRDCGLFGCIKGGTVEDLGVVDVDIRSGENTGAVAGALYGGTIRRCYSTGDVAASNGHKTSGGIAGRLYEDSSVRDCYSRANVEGSNAGGIVGSSLDPRIENCYSTGSITSYSVMGNDAKAAGIVSALLVRKGAVVASSVSLNPTLESDRFSSGRVIGRGYKVEGDILESDVTMRDNYAFINMKVDGDIPDNGTHDNWNGADFSYDSASQIFSTPWEDIFSDTSAWDMEPGKLPTLKGIGGQDGAIPEWMVRGNTADLYIGSLAELEEFRDRVNGAGGQPADDFAGKTVVLTADITMDGGTDWKPIGFYDANNPSVNSSFGGTFDGGGHTISGVSVRVGDTEYGGLFGRVINGNIKNLGIKDADIRGGRYSGAVVGMLHNGTIQNCYSTGRVSEAGYAGGIVGNSTGWPDSLGAVNDCYSVTDVEGKDGSKAGGIAGECTLSELKRCYSIGVVSILNGAAYNNMIGGVVGCLEDVNISHSAALNPSVTHQGSGNGRVVGIAMSTESGRIEFLKNNYAFSGMKVNGSTVTGGQPDDKNGADLTCDPGTGAFSTPWETIFNDTSAWDIQPGRLPVLKGLGGQDGTIPEWIWEREKASLLIGSEAELIAFRNMVNGTGGMEADDFEGKTVRLTADIRLTEEWTPIGVYTGFDSSQDRLFKGVFDGDGYMIHGLSIHDEGMMHAGLFSYVEGGTVKNLGLKGIEIEAEVVAGAVVGYLKNGIIRNCFGEGTIITAEGNTGGIAGMVSGSEIINCYSKGSVVSEGAAPAGGIAGMIGSGESHVEHCYSAGSVAASGFAGGLAGNLSGGVLDSVPLSGTVRQNAALLHSLEGGSGGSGIPGRIAGSIGTAPTTVISPEQNYGFSRMKVNGAPAEGDDGSGRNGMDGSLKDLVMDRTLFPASDWVLKEGCYPMLKVFADRGEKPIPLEYWLAEQAEGRFRIEVGTPASYTFPEAVEGYRSHGTKAVTVVNTGTEATGELTVIFAEQKKDGLAKPAGETDYFTLAEAAGSVAFANPMDSIAPGGTGSFAVAPADGLKRGTYTARLEIAGNYGLSASYEVHFTVRRGSGSDGDDEAPKKPEYTILAGEVPSSVGTGRWVRQPDGGWRFSKVTGVETGSSGGGIFAVKEWLMIDGFWYLFDEEGRMVTGWASVNGLWYYLSTAAYTAASQASLLKEGAMVTGWFLDPDTGFWYWLDENGAMAAGWREIAGKRYYFNPVSDGTRGALKEEAEQP